LIFKTEIAQVILDMFPAEHFTSAALTFLCKAKASCQEHGPLIPHFVNLPRIMLGCIPGFQELPKKVL